VNLNITFHHRDPQKALPWRKTRAHVLWAIARRNRSSGVARTRCGEYKNKVF